MKRKQKRKCLVCNHSGKLKQGRCQQRVLRQTAATMFGVDPCLCLCLRKGEGGQSGK